MNDDECASMSSVFCQFFSDKVSLIQHAIADTIKTISGDPLQMSRRLEAVFWFTVDSFHKRVVSGSLQTDQHDVIRTSRRLVMSFQRRW